jgi:hypothetical protein
MRNTAIILLFVLLHSGCSTPTAPVTAERPQFDIHSSEVVTAVVNPATATDHKAEIVLLLTEACVKRYEPFGKRYAKQDIDVLANGRPLLTALSAPAHWDTNMTVYIFTSVEDAQSLAHSLNGK